MVCEVRSLSTHFVGTGIYAPSNKVRSERSRRRDQYFNLFLFVNMAAPEFRFVKYDGLKTLEQIQ